MNMIYILNKLHNLIPIRENLYIILNIQYKMWDKIEMNTGYICNKLEQ